MPALLRTLQPLRSRGAEVVVVDGGSTDGTWLLASRGGADHVLVAAQGRASQMNAGAQGARADALLFLHADTVLPPEADRLVAQALAAGADWGRFDVRIAGDAPLLRLVGALMNLRSRWTGIATGDQALFVRREVFAAAGGFPDLPLMEDIALSTRLRRRGAPACLRATVATSARRWERHGVLRIILLMWWLRLRYFFGAAPQQLADRYGYRRRPGPAAAGVAVLAKAPVAGLAKTRLAPGIGAPAAARLQRAFTLDTLRTAQAAALGPVQLWCAPDAGHRFFRALHRRCGLALRSQVQGGLGERMRATAQSHFAQHPGLPLLVIGTDCPLLAPGHLQAAARALAGHDAVLIPAEDGGYVLLGLARVLPEVFEDIAWSTPAVLAQTRERLRAAGARWQELDSLWDVDEPADLRRFRELAPAGPVPGEGCA
ncbi:candidate b-glycosyltransferase, Glycosyltransferase Family 2 [Ramlibacter tataouinensis TTB310]|uniref:Candidate b-glycosyltransferase, Glycosyltransferase Family 2 n=1 Tax=Ramlibacter tataouinensis (strain ATCC BAA-407 / DSM 14655 / LMG 21543 / TTB310) TaxID=365046 RepID=F5Y5F5_RAMTT|nr:candidate b-glycosyltransferase, Glycosyltransferase Family 2 [Ramlibacter tataouinensis TTB310]